MQNPYYSKGLSRSLYNSSYTPSPSYYSDDYYYPNSRMPAKESSYYGERAYYDDFYANNAAKPQAKVWSDYIPIEKRYLDYVPQQKVEYMPVERNYTDYLEVEHQMDYVPVPKLQKHIEYIPVERYDQSVDYYPYEKSYVKSMGSGIEPRPNIPKQGGYYAGDHLYRGNPNVPPQNYQYAPFQHNNNYRYNSYGGGYYDQPPTRNYREGYWQNKY